MDETVDAVVVGGGHNGLVAAALLADEGWDVILLEASERVGGAVASRRIGEYVMDEFSACHPLAVASPVLQALDLGHHGLRWAQAPVPLVHCAGSDAPPAVLHADAGRTAALLDEDSPGDGASWLALVEQWTRLRDPLLRSLLTHWPPLRDPARLARVLGPAGLTEFARFALLPVHRMGEELFRGRAGRELLAGNAMHADISPDAPGSGLFGWMMSMLAQDVGMPSPVGGAGSLARALASRAEQAGVQIETGQDVERIVTRGGRATGVVVRGGRTITARRAVVANTSAPVLYQQLLEPDAVPRRVHERLRRFEWDLPTVKLNLALRGPVPWRSEALREAGLVHLGHDLPGLQHWADDLESGVVPDRPFVLAGQMSTIDCSRSPKGTQTLWAYTHLPRGRADDAAASHAVERMEQVLEELAPGVLGLAEHRWVQTPGEMQETNANLHDGAIAGGTMQLFQQGPLRPVPGLGGSRTPVDGLYLGSAASHPGGGVHGGCGYLAARAALADRRAISPGRVLGHIARRLTSR